MHHPIEVQDWQFISHDVGVLLAFLSEPWAVLGKCHLWKEPFHQMSLLLPGKPMLLTVWCRSMATSLLIKNGAILRGFLCFRALCRVKIGLEWGYILVQLLSLSNPIPTWSLGQQPLPWDLGAGSLTTTLLTMRPSSLLTEGTQIVPAQASTAIVKCFAVAKWGGMTVGGHVLLGTFWKNREE